MHYLLAYAQYRVFYAFILPDLARSLGESTCRKSHRDIDLSPDNAPLRNARRAQQETVKTKAMKAIYLAYFSDGAPSNFLLFDHLKSEMTGFTASSQ
jgi:hypothetical protein